MRKSKYKIKIEQFCTIKSLYYCITILTLQYNFLEKWNLEMIKHSIKNFTCDCILMVVLTGLTPKNTLGVKNSKSVWIFSGIILLYYIKLKEGKMWLPLVLCSTNEINHKWWQTLLMGICNKDKEMLQCLLIAVMPKYLQRPSSIEDFSVKYEILCKM